MNVESLINGGIVIIFGTLIVLARNRFAHSMMEQMRGFKGELKSKHLTRFLAVGMAIFGIIVIFIGVTIALGNFAVG
ncbi:hypothetical protein [Arthrobacter pascens]|uniref:hypothetical protein n=1 Tax=Arthrobacter pascens TaxID=1677 RepID=UPI00196AD49A|nr:hypothetical protein [Arthrobacter pascens]MBN3496577.1 hypothetical protein [Arthrobacter pascens]